MQTNPTTASTCARHLGRHAYHLLQALVIPATLVVAGWTSAVVTATNAHAATHSTRAAKPAASTTQATPASSTTRKRKKSGGPRIIKGSEENERERGLRLLRECKGRPNAGACLGYAS